MSSKGMWVTKEPRTGKPAPASKKALQKVTPAPAPKVEVKRKATMKGLGPASKTKRPPNEAAKVTAAKNGVNDGPATKGRCGQCQGCMKPACKECSACKRSMEHSCIDKYCMRDESGKAERESARERYLMAKKLAEQAESERAAEGQGQGQGGVIEVKPAGETTLKSVVVKRPAGAVISQEELKKLGNVKKIVLKGGSNIKLIPRPANLKVGPDGKLLTPLPASVLQNAVTPVKVNNGEKEKEAKEKEAKKDDAKK